MAKTERLETLDDALVPCIMLVAYQWCTDAQREVATAARADLRKAWDVRERARLFLEGAVVNEAEANSRYIGKRTDANYLLWLEAVGATKAARTILGEEPD